MTTNQDPEQPVTPPRVSATSERRDNLIQIGRSVGLLVAGVGVGWFLFAPAKEEPVETPAVVDTSGPTLVSLDRKLLPNAGLRIEPATKRDFTPYISLVGSIRFDEGKVADIGGRVSGRVTKLFVELGDHVEAGQAVAEIEGAELGDAVAEFLSARANLQAAQRESERQSALGQQQLTTATSVEESRARASAMGAQLRGAEQRLLAMGVAPASIRGEARGPVRSRIILRSPIAGEVVERSVVLGQVVDPTRSMLRVADLSQVWVQLDVYERDVVRVNDDDVVAVVSDAFPGETFHGKVDHIDSTIDERTRTARVRVVVDNADRRLRPGQFVNARLSPRTAQRPAIVLAPEAIMQIEGIPSVFVRKSENTFEVRNVRIGLQGEGVVEIAAGLVEGEAVVVEGAFALKSELLR